jgi:hypothetical protein
MTRRLRLEALEPRLTPADLFVANTGGFIVTTDRAPTGLSHGDTVLWNPGPGSQHGGPQTGLVYFVNAFPSIALAVDAAADGDVIRVGPGVFNESVTVDRAVTLFGNQVGADASTRTGPETVVRGGGTTVSLEQSGVRLDGFTIDGPGGGTTGVATANPLAGIRIEGNIITSHRTGLLLNTVAGGERSEVSGNLFRDNGGTTDSDAIRSSIRLEDVTIRGNVVTGVHPSSGIEIFGSFGTGQGVLIERNTLTGPNAGTAVGIRFGNHIPLSSQVAVRNNFISNWSNGVQLADGRDGITVRGNHLTGNGSALVAAGPAVLDAGFNFYGVIDEAGVDAVVNGPWDFRPFLTDGTDASPNLPGFQPVLKPTLLSAKTATYFDPDGDLITVRVSKGTLGDANFRFGLPERGDGLFLDELNLDDQPDEFAGTDVTITARRTAAGGDGLASGVGRIDGSNLDLGTVTVRGALGILTCGDGAATPGRPAVKRVDILATDRRDDRPRFAFDGAVGSFRCRGEFVGSIFVERGDVSSLVIGGSVAQLPGALSPSTIIVRDRGVGSLTIRGDLLGRVHVFENVGRLTVGGSLMGGSPTDSGSVHIFGNTGPITVGGSLVGGSGTASGSVAVEGNSGPVSIGGSLVGGSGTASGSLFVDGRAAAVTVRGSVVGGPAGSAASIRVGSAGRVAIRGDLLGGGFNGAGSFSSAGDVSGLTVGGSVVGGRDETGQGKPGGGIRIHGRAGPIAIGRDLRGDPATGAGPGTVVLPVTLSVQGRPGPATQADGLALAGLTVGGSVTNAQVLIGYFDEFAVNPDAAAGPILVKGGWTASTLAVGVEAGADRLFGTTDDAPIAPSANFPDAPGVVARVRSLTVLGPVSGSTSDPDEVLSNDHFGLVAEAFGTVKLAGLTLPLTAGLDRLAIGPTLDFRLVEV